MKVYFAPFSCSLAVRILVNELGLKAEFCQVKLATKTLADGERYSDINEKVQVPSVLMDDAELLTEVGPILVTLADHFGSGEFVAKAGSAARRRQTEWLSFLSGELHKSVFYPIYHPAANSQVMEFSRSLANRPYDILSAKLADSMYLEENYSIADMLLVVLLSWSEHSGIDIDKWPVLKSYRTRICHRPAISKSHVRGA